MRFENRNGSKENKKKNTLWKVKILFFIIVIFSLLLFISTSKMISRAWGNKRSHNILNHSKWSTYVEDINKCLIIDRRLVMGQSTLVPSEN
jgi:hypothetical protein